MDTVASRLADRIRREGPLPFAAVMEEALYGPGGYYARDRIAIGPYGDFVTGSSLSPLYGQATGRVLARLAGALPGPADYLEVGYGGGEHLEAVASTRGDGEAGRTLCWDRVRRPVPPGASRLDSLSELGEHALEGLIFSYELFDALPVHRLIGRAGGGVGELRVGWRDGEGFTYVETELSAADLAGLLGGHALEPGQIADLAPGWDPLYRTLARSLRRGLLVTCDYGYERRGLLDARVRRHGTLACYSKQRVHRDALRRLGEEDLTAHVDWTTLRRAGEAEGLETVVLTRQARWLIAAGLFDEIAAAGPAAASAARTLLDGDGMGEEIRVLVQSRGVDLERVLDLAILGAGERPSP